MSTSKNESEKIAQELSTFIDWYNFIISSLIKV